MTGCQTCGGFGSHHDPVAHGAAGEPEDGYELQWDGWPARDCDHENGECHDARHSDPDWPHVYPCPECGGNGCAGCGGTGEREAREPL